MYEEYKLNRDTLYTRPVFGNTGARPPY